MKKKTAKTLRARGLPASIEEIETHFQKVGEQCNRMVAEVKRQKEALENYPEDELKKILRYRISMFWDKYEIDIADDMRLLLEIEMGKFKPTC